MGAISAPLRFSRNFLEDGGMKISLGSYLKKPVARNERRWIAVIILLLVPILFVGDIVTYFFVDACYDGLFADLLDWYTDNCEAGGNINVLVGNISMCLTLCMLLAIFRLKPRFLAAIPLTSLFLTLTYSTLSLLYYSHRNLDQIINLKVALLFFIIFLIRLLFLFIILYLICSIIRRYRA